LAFPCFVGHVLAFAGEAGAYPNITRALQNWLPIQERGLGQGSVWFCGKLMGGLTPTIWTLLVAGTACTPPLINWRMAFWIFGLLGLLWCVLFALPSFLEQQYHVSPTSLVGAIYKGGPLWMGVIGCLAGGLITDTVNPAQRTQPSREAHRPNVWPRSARRCSP